MNYKQVFSKKETIQMRYRASFTFYIGRVVTKHFKYLQGDKLVICEMPAWPKTKIIRKTKSVKDITFYIHMFAFYKKLKFKLQIERMIYNGTSNDEQFSKFLFIYNAL